MAGQSQAGQAFLTKTKIVDGNAAVQRITHDNSIKKMAIETTLKPFFKKSLLLLQKKVDGNAIDYRPDSIIDNVNYGKVTRLLSKASISFFAYFFWGETDLLNVLLL